MRPSPRSPALILPLLILSACADITGAGSSPDGSTDPPKSLASTLADDIFLREVAAPGADEARGLDRVELEVVFDLRHLRELRRQARYGFAAVDQHGNPLTIDQVIEDLENGLRRVHERKAARSNRRASSVSFSLENPCTDCPIDGDIYLQVEGNQDLAAEATFSWQPASYETYPSETSEVQYVLNNMSARTWWTASYLSFGPNCRALQAHSITSAPGAYYS